MTETMVDASLHHVPPRHVSTHGLCLTFITKGDGLAALHPYLVVVCVCVCVRTSGCGCKVKAARLSQSGAR